MAQANNMLKTNYIVIVNLEVNLNSLFILKRKRRRNSINYSFCGEWKAQARTQMWHPRAAARRSRHPPTTRIQRENMVTLRTRTWCVCKGKMHSNTCVHSTSYVVAIKIIFRLEQRATWTIFFSWIYKFRWMLSRTKRLSESSFVRQVVTSVIRHLRMTQRAHKIVCRYNDSN